MRRYIVIGYLVALAMSVGVVLVLGVIVAPVVFHTETLLAVPLARYDAGLVMTEIFVRSNYWWMAMMIFIALYEGYDYKMGRKDMGVMGSAAVAVATMALFVFYYTPDILSMQAAHTTDTPLFEKVHFGSELDFKILLVALLVLLLRRFGQLVRPKL